MNFRIHKPGLILSAALLLALLLAPLAFGAPAVPWPVDFAKDDGLDLGRGVVLQPQVEALAGYDDRVRYSTDGGKTGDAYSDLAVAAELKNQSAAYEWWLKGRIGWRQYAQETALSDTFYTAAARLQTEQEPFTWKLAADLTKTLDQSTGYDADSGTDPDPVLTYLANTRLYTQAAAAYDKHLFGKTSVVPGYNFSYYRQDYEESGYEGNEWMIHSARLLMRHRFSKKTRIAAGLDYSLQLQDEENGTIGTALIGVDYRITQKSTWSAELGYALANYDLSGEDQGFVSRLRGRWQYTKKVDFYAFGGNSFQPGYDGEGARMVYRLGYGAGWQAAPKLKFKGAVLHDYQDLISGTTSDPAYGTLRHYIDLTAAYEPVKALSLIAGYRFNDDERPDPQNKLYLSAVYRFY